MVVDAVAARLAGEPAGRVIVVTDDPLTAAVAQNFQPAGGIVAVVDREAALIGPSECAGRSW